MMYSADMYMANQATPKDTEFYKAQYDEIVRLYDLAEELADTALAQDKDLSKEQLALIKPLAMDVEEAADVLTEEYIGLVETQGKAAPKAKPRVERALRKIFAAIFAYNDQTADRQKRFYKNLYNHADPVVQKLKDLAEKVVAVFLHFVQLSIETIVPKWEVEELKKRNIAIGLHNISIDPA